MRFESAKKAANNGSIDGMIEVGLCYDYGLGVAESHEEGTRWFTKAASTGDRWAMYVLGKRYEEGIFVSQSDQIALQWYEASAKKGLLKAQEAVRSLERKKESVSENDSSVKEEFTTIDSDNEFENFSTINKILYFVGYGTYFLVQAIKIILPIGLIFAMVMALLDI